ncbi:SH3 domain-containing protein [Pseudogemmobacter sp. W21_MBD1_M6]|uniref:SH3 domain-containing protein n=1 Tax=Pseudogemmobacter sp. W21_MBD1_M6 TaxID=3240271 RepID=UPI003F96E369
MVRLAALLGLGVWLVLLIAGNGETAQPARTQTARVSQSPFAATHTITKDTEFSTEKQVIPANAKTPQVNPLVVPTEAAQRAIKKQPEAENVRYVIGARVNLRAEPTTKSAILAKLEFGTKAIALQTNDDGWVRIRHVGSGIEGFMAKTFLRINPPG